MRGQAPSHPVTVRLEPGAARESDGRGIRIRRRLCTPDAPDAGSERVDLGARFPKIPEMSVPIFPIGKSRDSRNFSEMQVPKIFRNAGPRKLLKCSSRKFPKCRSRKFPKCSFRSFRNSRKFPKCRPPSSRNSRNADREWIHPMSDG